MMKISTVDGCLCFELETAGRIIGWLGIIGGTLMVIFASATLMVLSLMSCKEFYELMQEQDLHNFLTEISITECQILKAFVLVAAILILGCSIIHTIVDIVLLIGIQKRDPGKIIPAVVIQAIGTFTIIFRGLASFSIEGIITAIIIGCIAYYIFVVLYSLYVKIRTEQTPRYENQIIGWNVVSKN